MFSINTSFDIVLLVTTCRLFDMYRKPVDRTGCIFHVLQISLVFIFVICVPSVFYIHFLHEICTQCCPQYMLFSCALWLLSVMNAGLLWNNSAFRAFCIQKRVVFTVTDCSICCFWCCSHPCHQPLQLLLFNKWVPFTLLFVELDILYTSVLGKNCLCQWTWAVSNRNVGEPGILLHLTTTLHSNTNYNQVSKASVSSHMPSMEYLSSR